MSDQVWPNLKKCEQVGQSLSEFDNFNLQLDNIHFDENDDLWEPLENISQPFLLRSGDADL